MNIYLTDKKFFVNLLCKFVTTNSSTWRGHFEPPARTGWPQALQNQISALFGISEFVCCLICPVVPKVHLSQLYFKFSLVNCNSFVPSELQFWCLMQRLRFPFYFKVLSITPCLIIHYYLMKRSYYFDSLRLMIQYMYTFHMYKQQTLLIKPCIWW